MNIFSVFTSLVVSTFILLSAYGFSTISCVDDGGSSVVVNSERTAAEIIGMSTYKRDLRCSPL